MQSAFCTDRIGIAVFVRATDRRDKKANLTVHKGKQTRHAMEIALSRNYVEKNVKLRPTELIPGPLLAENTSFL